MGMLSSLIKKRIHFTVISSNVIFCGEKGSIWMLMVYKENEQLIKDDHTNLGGSLNYQTETIRSKYAVRELRRFEISELRELITKRLIRQTVYSRLIDGEQSKCNVYLPKLYISPDENNKRTYTKLSAKEKKAKTREADKAKQKRAVQYAD